MGKLVNANERHSVPSSVKEHDNNELECSGEIHIKYTPSTY